MSECAVWAFRGVDSLSFDGCTYRNNATPSIAYWLHMDLLLTGVEYTFNDGCNGVTGFTVPRDALWLYVSESYPLVYWSSSFGSLCAAPCACRRCLRTICALLFWNPA